MEKLKEIPRNKIIQGDTLEVLKTFPNESIDTIMTSPPYWSLRDYGIDGQIGLEPTLEEFIKKLLAITYELKRILKKTGVMYWNHGDCYATGAKESGEGIERKTGYNHKTMMNQRRQVGETGVPAKCLVLQNWRLILRMIDEQGWILRNTIIWNKPNHMPSSVQDRYANSYEPVYMLVKSKRYNFDLDAVRIPITTLENRPMGIEREKDYPNAKRNKFAFNYKTKKQKFITPEEQKATQDKTGWKDGSGRIRSFFDNYGGKSNPKGKNPSDVWNIPENKKSLDNRMKDTKSPKGSLAYNMKKTLSEVRLGIKPRLMGITGKGFQGHSGNLDKDGNPLCNPIGKNPGDVWKIATQPLPECHFAAFPEKLCVKPIKSSCPQWICKKCGKARTRIIKIHHDNPKQSQEQYKKVAKEGQGITEHQNYKLTAGLRIKGNVSANHETLGWTDCKCGAGWKKGIVLDPFCGAATTLVAAKNLNRDYIGIELSKKYIEIAEKRIQNKAPANLFENLL